MKYFAFIIFFFSLLANASWEVQQDWNYQDGYYQIKLTESISAINCEDGKSLLFPNVMHSIQEVLMDGKIIYYYGSKDRSFIRSIYGSPIIDCRLLNGNRIEWVVKSPFKFFSKISNYPYVQSKYNSINQSEVKHLTIYGSLFLFFLIIFFGMGKSELKTQARALAFFSLSMAIFFLSSVFGLVGVKLTILSVDKIAASSLGMATFFYVRFLSKRYGLSKHFLNFTNFTTIPGTVIIPFVSNGDIIQIILNVIFAPGIVAVWYSLIFLIKEKNEITLNNRVLNLFALLSFALATSLDMAYTFGLHSYGMVIGYGVIGTVFFFTRLLQIDIDRAYVERDFLRTNLEKEVERKTNELKVAQAELAQSAKLASLGTLSAGLAHEINNAVNYVNGALVPLERLVGQSIEDQVKKNKVDKLFQVMKDGLNLTVEIIKSLRNYTGLNQAKFNDLSLKEVVSSVCVILKNKLKERISLEILISDDHVIFGSVVGLNQVFMNIISNAADAMGETGGKLTIKSEKIGDSIKIDITDSGPGIPNEIKDRIFDPFFTTKGVGQGTGLGLFIVKKEIDKHQGKLEVQSELGRGTTFSITLPIRATGIEDKVA